MTARPPGPAQVGPAQVGAELRAVREQLGWSITELSVRLKIRIAQLEAIEAGDLAALPAPAYATGFIRAYADMIGLDSDEILRRFRAAGMVPPKQPRLAFPRPVPDRAVPPGALALLVLLIGVGAYLLWYRHTEHQRHLAQAVPPIPAKLAPLAIPKDLRPKQPAAKPAPISTTAPSPTAPSTTPTTSSATANPQPQAPAAKGSGAPAPTPTSAPTSGPTPALAPPIAPSVATTPITAAPSFRPVGTPVTPPGTPPATPSSTPQAAPALTTPMTPGPLAVAATVRSWVEIRDATGKILFTRILKPGEYWPVPHEPGLTISTGNAGGTVLLHNGQPSAPLGASGVVLRHVELTPPAPTSAGSTPAPAAQPTAAPSGAAPASASPTPTKPVSP